MNSLSENYSLRLSTLADFDFLCSLHSISMRSHVLQIWGKWDEEEKRDEFRKKFTPETYVIIMVGKEPVGVIAFTQKETEIFIDRFEILPMYQNKGIGTSILKRYISDAQENKKSVSLSVLRTNTRAKTLYERLGFSVTNEVPERWYMSYKFV